MKKQNPFPIEDMKARKEQLKKSAEKIADDYLNSKEGQELRNQLDKELL
jgi:hypothetical protein